MVRSTGLEPVRQRHTHLKRACLPVPARPHMAPPGVRLSDAWVIIAFVPGAVNWFFIRIPDKRILSRRAVVSFFRKTCYNNTDNENFLEGGA